jgi:redox-sensitive bicupin YhaK (pirin superfamily)
MPEQEHGRMEGFQLWLNLPAKDKLCKPWYRDFTAAQVPSFTTAQGADVRIIAGSSHGVQGAVQRDVTQPLYVDVTLPQGAQFSQHIPAGHNAFIFVYRGTVQIDGKPVASGRMAIFENARDSDGVRVEALDDTRFILLAGQPLNEPIAQYGPFVMNTQAELMQAVEDFRAGLLGEEAHPG